MSGMDSSAILQAPLDSTYPDPEGMLVGICDWCGISLDICICAITTTSRRAQTFTADTFLNHPDWQEMFSMFPEPLPEPLPSPTLRRIDSQPLQNEVLRLLEENATTVQPSTVVYHVEGTYLPGDRLEQAASQCRTQRRHAPCPGGYSCDLCSKSFNRACELNRHKKTHVLSNERPHKCSVCRQGFLYPKDRARHERTHDSSPSPSNILFCRVAGCSNDSGFSRRDNLLRHHRKQHPSAPIPA